MNIRNIYMLLFTTDAKNVDSATKSLLTCIVASILHVLSLNLSNFALIQHHKWSLTVLEDMLPYERDIYVAMLKNWIEEENERIRQQQKH